MMRTALIAAFLAASVQAAESPAFDVAAIKTAQPGREGIQTEPGSVTMRNVRLNDCIRWAYGVAEFQVSGPAWLDEVRFDIFAKAGSPVPEADLRAMMQTLLAQRFHLAVHRQKKEIAALILTVSKSGHKLQPVDTEGSPSFKTGKMTLTGQGATVEQLTSFLSNAIRNPIIDETGLKGRYNYSLDINAYVTEEMLKSAGQGPPADAPTIIAQAVQAQLGLKLDSRKAPVEMVVVDHMDKAPTEN